MFSLPKKGPLLATVLILGAIGLFTFLPRSPSSPKELKETLYIGAILPLTGDFANFGQEIHRGAQLAVKDATQQGKNVEYIVEDDKTSSKGAIEAAAKLIRASQVESVFTATYLDGKTTAPLFNQSDIPLLVTWDSNQYLKTAGANIFSSGFSSEGSAETMADYAYQTLGVKRLAIAHHSEEWSELTADAFEKRFTSLGGTVVLKEKMPQTQKDYRTVLAKIKTLKVDGVYSPLNPPANALFYTQANQLGLKTVFMSGNGFLEDEIAEAGAATEGVYFTQSVIQQTDPLTAKYKAAFNAEPSMPFVAFGYDAINTLIAAHDIAQTRSISIRDALKQVDIQGSGRERIKLNGTQSSERFDRLHRVVNGKMSLWPSTP